MAVADKVTFKEFCSPYNSEETCKEELFRQRFLNGGACPKCSCTVQFDRTLNIYYNSAWHLLMRICKGMREHRALIVRK